MSIFKKLAAQAGLAQPVTALGKAATELTRRVNQKNGRFLGENFASAMYSTESIAPNVEAELHTAFQDLSATLESIADYFTVRKPSGDMQELSVAGKEAAVAAGMVSSDPMRFFNTKPTMPAMESNAVVVDGVAGDFIERLKPSMEAYDETELRNTTVYSILYNAVHGAQDEFAETFFPTVTVPADQAGYTISMNIIRVAEDRRRQVSGARDDFGFRNIIHAIIDPEILRNDQTLLVPVYSDESKDKFVDEAVLPTRVVDLEGESIKTSALAFGKKFSLLGISQNEALLQTGFLDITDAIDSGVTLQNVYLKVGSEVIRINTDGLPFTNFTYATQDNYRLMRLNWDTDTVQLSKFTKLVDGSDSTELAQLYGDDGKLVQLSFSINGSINTQTGDTNLTASSVSVHRVYDGATKLSLEDGVGKEIADKIATAELIGYDLHGYRTNSNLRQRGQLLDLTYQTQIYPVKTRAPITMAHPMTSPATNDARDVSALITATGVRTTNAAIDALFRTADLLREHATNEISISEAPTVLGIAHGPVKAFYEEGVIDVLAEINSLKSHEKAADIQAVLVAKLRDVAYRMYRDSGYKAAADALNGGKSNPPTVIIGTDPVISRYLLVNGDLRTLGADFNFKVVTTLNKKVKGRIFMSFTDEEKAKAGVPNPLGFGNMAWKPELVMNFPIHYNGANSKQIMVQPSFLHVCNLPVLAMFEVKGLSDTAAMKVTIDTTEVKARVGTIDQGGVTRAGA